MASLVRSARRTPRLPTELTRTWGHVTSVTVNGATWSAVPGRMLVFNEVVRLHRTVAASSPHTIVLLAPGRGALGPTGRAPGYD